MFFARVLGWSALPVVVVWFLLPDNVYRLDLDVYRLGVQAWLDGGDPFGMLPDTAAGLNLPFIYPPISLALLSPFTVTSFSTASIALTVLTIALTAGVATIVLDSLRLPRTWLVLLPVALLIEPVRMTMDYGQINVLLMALVVADCLVKTPRWPRGALVGLAAAIKLTPAAFILFFLLRRDFRSALTAGVAFLAVTAVGFALAWNESVRFWTDEVFHTGDKVGVDFLANQSILGVLTRWGTGSGALWLVLVALTLAAAVAGMRRAEPVQAMGINALAMLLVSPISWSHHWVWCVPILLGLFADRARVLAATGLVLFLAAPHWWPANPLLPQVTDDSYFWFAAATLAVYALRRRTWHTSPRGPAGAADRHQHHPGDDQHDVGDDLVAVEEVQVLHDRPAEPAEPFVHQPGRTEHREHDPESAEQLHDSER